MEAWIKFKLIKKPYYNPKTGSVLSSIAGRQNRPRVDAFRGGGKARPDFSKVNVRQRYENSDDLLVLIDGEQAQVDILLTNKPILIQVSPTATVEDVTGFMPELLSDAEAEALKSVVFSVDAECISGVTE